MTPEEKRIKIMQILESSDHVYDSYDSFGMAWEKVTDFDYDEAAYKLSNWMTEQEIENLREAVSIKMAAIRALHFENNLPIVYLKDGWIVKEYKNGKIKKIKRIEQYGTL